MTFIFREVTTGNTSHGVRRLVEHATSLLSTLEPSSALGKKAKKTKKKTKKKRGKTAKKSASALTNLFAFSSSAEPDYS